MISARNLHLVAVLCCTQFLSLQGTQKSSTACMKPRTVMFDWNYTLADTDVIAALQEEGLQTAITEKNQSEIYAASYKKFSEFLQAMGALPEIQKLAAQLVKAHGIDPKGTSDLLDPTGKKLPEFVATFDRGIYSIADMQQMIALAWDMLKKNGEFFKDATDEIYVRTYNKLVFTDKAFRVKHTFAVPGAIEFLEELHNCGHTIGILSNIASEIFDAIYATPHMKPIFKHIKRKRCILSGDFKGQDHMFKPEAEFFQYMLDKLKLSADDVVFVDDTVKNVEASKKFGIEQSYAFPYKPFKYPNSFKELEKVFMQEHLIMHDCGVTASTHSQTRYFF